ncbi:hypothetical protein BV22DRAFT_1052268 [Leucogyrophana mollusca]|uniref:Uncharacterized protein n=1 Tax=Leucogyrophana mollusca TaxID=85980 RepID=A0ACB8AVW3_9AGAM|nr:hypothetical protein BV22DRAFT_1052268 [Leucogyrophana mollusca]
MLDNDEIQRRFKELRDDCNAMIAATNTALTKKRPAVSPRNRVTLGIESDGLDGSEAENSDEEASLADLQSMYHFVSKEISSRKARLTIKLLGKKRIRSEESLTYASGDEASESAWPQLGENQYEVHHKKAKLHCRQPSESSVDEGDMVDGPPTSTRCQKSSSAPAKKRGRPPKPKPVPEAPVNPPPPETNFCVSIFVTVELPPRVIKGKTAQGDKTEKREDFLSLLAGVVRTKPEYLAVNSMGWYWNGKPKKTMLALSSNMGLQMMVKQILASKTGDAGVIFVTMAMPQKPKWESLPWLDNDLDDTCWDSECNKENEPKSRLGAKISVNRKIAPIVETLEGMYPVGNCRKHPEIRCFAHGPTKCHFELDSNRLKVWALAIDREKTDYDRIPIGSSFFLPTDAIVAKAEPVTPNCENVAAPSEAGQYPMGPHMPFGHPYPPQYGHPPPPPPGFYQGYNQPMMPPYSPPGYPNQFSQPPGHYGKAVPVYNEAHHNAPTNTQAGPSVICRQPIIEYPPPPGPPPSYLQPTNN